jgi:hypothetical protein
MVPHQSHNATCIIHRPCHVGIQDIIQALQNPTANSPLAPCTDSQVQALQDLTSLLTGIPKAKKPNHKDTLNLSPEIILTIS